MKLLLTAILKDDSEKEMAERMLDSFMPYFDGLAVAITGTSGNNQALISLIKKHKGQFIITTPETHPSIYLKKDDKWIFANFAEARNASFKLAESMGEYDFWSWADVDDVLLGGEQLHDVAQNALDKNVDSVFFTYWYSVVLDDKGDIVNVITEHGRERLMKPGVFKWISRLHEVAVPKDDNYKPTNAPWFVNEKEGKTIVWAHLSTHDRQLEALKRNLELLLAQREEEQSKDPRTLFYLAKCYIDMAQDEDTALNYQAAQDLLDDYLVLSGWEEERSDAWYYKAFIFDRLKDHRKAIDMLFQSMKEFSGKHLTYLLLAKQYAEIGKHDEADRWLDTVLSMPAPATRTTIGNPMEVKIMASMLQYNRSIRKQDVDGALQWVQTKNQLLGIDNATDPMYQELMNNKSLNQAATWIFNYAKWLKDNKQAKQLTSFITSIPEVFTQYPFYQWLVTELQEPKIWSKDEITYFCPTSFAQWDPDTALQDGLGGSETAVIRLSEEWSKLGYKVTVYANVTHPTEHNGVVYKHWTQLNFKDEFNVLVLWRNIGALDKDFKAKKLFVDLHDVTSNLEFNKERIEKLDAVFVKSKYHRNMIPAVPDAKVHIISNGI